MPLSKVRSWSNLLINESLSSLTFLGSSWIFLLSFVLLEHLHLNLSFSVIEVLVAFVKLIPWSKLLIAGTSKNIDIDYTAYRRIEYIKWITFTYRFLMSSLNESLVLIKVIFCAAIFKRQAMNSEIQVHFAIATLKFPDWLCKMWGNYVSLMK